MRTQLGNVIKNNKEVNTKMTIHTLVMFRWIESSIDKEKVRENQEMISQSGKLNFYFSRKSRVNLSEKNVYRV